MNEIRFFNRGDDKPQKASAPRPLTTAEIIGGYFGQAPNWLWAIAISTALMGCGFFTILFMGWK